MKKELKDKTIYELNPSQEVINLQLAFSFDKRVINIISSVKYKDGFDNDLMKQAINKMIERNDCTRIKFIKYKGKLCQYFDDNAKLDDIPCYEFSTQEQFDKFVEEKRRKPIAYKKGKVIEFSLIKMPDGGSMIFMKVCHLIVDTYGIFALYKDIFEIYDALKNGTEFPKEPGKFEELVKKDMVRKHDKEYDRKNREYFTELYSQKPEPYYAGIHGLKSKLAIENYEKRSMPIFLFNNQTNGFMRNVDKETTAKLFDFCSQNRLSPANFLLFAVSITLARMNRNTKNMLQLELCNCRPTAAERNCAGTKVQTVGCYLEFDYDKTIQENFDIFSTNQNTYYRHIGYSDVAFSSLIHKVWKSSVLRSYYPFTFSFVPMVQPEGVDIQIYPNGRFALACYFAILYDVNTSAMKFVYEAQKKLINEADIDLFQKNYVSVINQLLDDRNVLLKDVKVDLGE